MPVAYSNVCRCIIGYQIGTNDAFCPFQEVCGYHNPRNLSLPRYPSSPRADSIDDVYVDGLSLTHSYPREHIWTFAVAVNDVDGQRCPEYLHLAVPMDSRTLNICALIHTLICHSFICKKQLLL